MSFSHQARVTEDMAWASVAFQAVLGIESWTLPLWNLEADANSNHTNIYELVTLLKAVTEKFMEFWDYAIYSWTQSKSSGEVILERWKSTSCSSFSRITIYCRKHWSSSSFVPLQNFLLLSWLGMLVREVFFFPVLTKAHVYSLKNENHKSWVSHFYGSSLSFWGTDIMPSHIQFKLKKNLYHKTDNTLEPF